MFVRVWRHFIKWVVDVFWKFSYHTYYVRKKRPYFLMRISYRNDKILRIICGNYKSLGIVSLNSTHNIAVAGGVVKFIKNGWTVNFTVSFWGFNSIRWHHFFLFSFSFFAIRLKTLRIFKMISLKFVCSV